MKRHLGLDVLRGIAVLLVLVAHLPDGPPSAIVRACHRTGWIGVDLFFVLSGFLVSGLLFREHQRHGALNIGRFLVRRGLKIYPAYYAYLGITLLCLAAFGAQFTWFSVGAHVVYLQNYLYLAGAKPPDLWGHTWTLAIEEHFYLLLAASLWTMARQSGPNPFRVVPWLCLAVSVVCLGLRVASMHWLPHSYASHYSPTHLRLDSLTTGVAFSYFLNYHHAATKRFVRRWTIPLLLAGLELFLVVPLRNELHETRWMWTIGLTIVALGGVLLVAVVAVRDWSSITVLRPLAAIGRSSYSIYLWHPVAMLPLGLYHFVVLRVGVPPGSWAYFGVCLVYPLVAILIGMLATRLVETPVLRVRDRLWPSLAGNTATEPPADESAPVDGNKLSPSDRKPELERAR